MSLREVGKRVKFAEDIHKNKQLSQLIQRELKRSRAQDIADYLKTNDERFFNSLVVAVYGGDPAWHQLDDVKAESGDIDIDDVSSDAIASIGFLSFTGKERLFALDGQHRLAGIQLAIKEKPQLAEDEVSVIFVSHKDTENGIRRTRRLFTTLNKTAKPVSKGEIIALDESDVMAIVARDLVEHHPYFSGDRILVVAKSNLPVGDMEHLTTVVNLYDVLTLLFSKVKQTVPVRQLQFNRPTDDELDDYRDFAIRYFTLLGDTFKHLGQYFASAEPERIVKRYRTASGGSVLFRPVGLTIFARVIGAIARERSLKRAVVLAGHLPTDLNSEPYRGLLWNSSTRTVEVRRQVLVRRLLLYMVGMISGKKKIYKLRADLAKALDLSLQDCALPERIISHQR